MQTAERRAAIVASTGATIFALVALVGLDRSYDYDESVTVANFVRSGSFWDAISMQLVFNNHPAFTALAWPVNALGGTTEAWIRLPALLAGAVTIGLLGWASTRRWGAASGVAAMAVVAANPLFFELSREARGYSIAAFAVLTTSLLLPQVTREESSTTARVGYAALVGLGLLAHLYAAIAFAAHGAWVVWHRRNTLERWTRLSLLGGLIAVVTYAPMLAYMLDQSRDRQGRFDATFPIDAAQAVFGSPAAATLGLITFAIGLTRLPRWWPSTAAVVALLVIVWVGFKPYDLYPRFLVWLVPVGGLVIAAVMPRSPRLVVPAVVGLLLLSVPVVADVSAAESPIRSTARWVSETVADGTQVCFLGFFAESYEAYLDPRRHEAGRCDVTLVRRADLEQLTIGDGRILGVATDASVCAIALESAPPQVKGTTSTC